MQRMDRYLLAEGWRLVACALRAQAIGVAVASNTVPSCAEGRR